jgi:hypothetical protein
MFRLSPHSLISIFSFCNFDCYGFMFSEISWASAYTRMVLAQSDADESESAVAASAAASQNCGSTTFKRPSDRSSRGHSDDSSIPVDSSAADADSGSSARESSAEIDKAEQAATATVPAYLRSVHTLHVQLQRLRGAADSGDDDDNVYVKCLNIFIVAPLPFWLQFLATHVHRFSECYI